MPGILLQSGQLHRITGSRSDPALRKASKLVVERPRLAEPAVGRNAL